MRRYQAARCRVPTGAGVFRGGLRLGFAPGCSSCASSIMRMSRWVGMLALAAFAFRVASSAAGRRRLIDASLRASSKRTFFMPERSYSERSVLCSQASASSSLLKSGNFFDIAFDLLLVHEPHADRPDSVPSPSEDAKNPTARAVAETQNPPLAGHDRIADDIDIAREQSLDLRRRYAMPKAFRQVATVPVEAP